MVANLGGLTDPGGTVGAASAAPWLFACFAIAPTLCILTAARAARAGTPPLEVPP